jgi:hypothetical protein
MKLKYLLAAAVLATQTGFSQEEGTYAFLRLDMGARPGALNGSFVTASDDPNLLYYNPAGLPTLERPHVSLAYVSHLLDVSAGSLSYGQVVEGFGALGGGIRFIDYGTFTRTDESMNTLGTFGARELALTVGWGIFITDDVTVGAALEFIHSSLADYRSSGLAGSLGLLYFIPAEQLTFGVSVLHLGAQLSSYAGVREPLPLDVKIGMTKRPEHLPVNLSVNFHKLTERREKLLEHLASFSIGAEFLLSESLRLRFGYSNEQRREMKLGTSSGLAGFAAGGGVIFGEYLVDYAFSSYGKIGGLHRLSVGILL